MESRSKDAVTYTALAALALGIGVFLFTMDMRTVGAPPEHVFLADTVTCLLGVVAVAAGVPAVALWFAEHRQQRDGY